MIKLSIIIVNWNTKDLLKQCLGSVSGGCGGVEGCEVIVVDNGSNDGSVEMIRKLRITNYELRIIENKENLGFAKGNNIGICEAKGEYVFFINSDTVLEKDSVLPLINSLENDQKVGAVSPLVLNTDKTIQKDPCYLKLPSITLTIFYYNKYLKSIANKYFPKVLYSTNDFSKDCYVEQLPGAALMVRKKILDKIMGFDESFKIYFEDTDLCTRIKKDGYKLLLNPKAKIVHLGRQSIKSLIDKEGIEKFYFLNFNSLFKYCKRYLPAFNFLMIKSILFIQFAITGKFNLIKSLSKN